LGNEYGIKRCAIRGTHWELEEHNWEQVENMIEHKNKKNAQRKKNEPSLVYVHWLCCMHILFLFLDPPNPSLFCLGYYPLRKHAITIHTYLMEEKKQVTKQNQLWTRGVSHRGLAIYIKSIFKAKEELWKFKYFTMQKYNLQKKSSKRNQNPSIYHINSITSLKFQHKPKYHVSKIFI